MVYNDFAIIQTLELPQSRGPPRTFYTRVDLMSYTPQSPVPKRIPKVSDGASSLWFDEDVVGGREGVRWIWTSLTVCRKRRTPSFVGTNHRSGPLCLRLSCPVKYDHFYYSRVKGVLSTILFRSLRPWTPWIYDSGSYLIPEKSYPGPKLVRKWFLYFCLTQY